MRVLCAIGLSLILVGAAAAQTNPKDDPVLAAFGIHVVQRMSPQETAATRAKVDQALAKDGGAGAFENITDQNGGEVRHLASGLTCGLGKPGQSVRVVSPDEAVCRSEEGETVYELRVVRAPPGAALAWAYQDTLAKIAREPDYAPWRGVSIEGHPKTGSGLPDHRTLRFFSRVDGKRRFNRLQVGMVNGWILTSRRSGPEPKATQADSMGELLSEATFGSEIKPARAPSTPPPGH